MKLDNKEMNEEQTVIFLHIPKTAGVTMESIIQRQYYPQSITAFPASAPERAKQYNEFKKLSESAKRRNKLIRGHICFGLHEFLPQQSTYITFLRDPVERVISLFYFIRRVPGHPYYSSIVSSNMSLEEFVCSGMGKQIDNVQTRVLTDSWNVEFGKCSHKMLESAKSNIDNYFAVVGLTGRFDESLILLKQKFGWKNIFYQRKNVTKNRPLQEDIADKTLEEIKKYNELDIELYRYAEGLLEESIKQQGDAFLNELNRFKLLNKTLGNVYLSSDSLRNKITKKVSRIGAKLARVT